jgi:hypothetical protein
MEQFNFFKKIKDKAVETYRDKLAGDLKEIKKEDPEKAQELLAKKKESKLYQIADEHQAEKREEVQDVFKADLELKKFLLRCLERYEREAPWYPRELEATKKLLKQLEKCSLTYKYTEHLENWRSETLSGIINGQRVSIKKFSHYSHGSKFEAFINDKKIRDEDAKELFMDYSQIAKARSKMIEDVYSKRKYGYTLEELKKIEDQELRRKMESDYEAKMKAKMEKQAKDEEEYKKTIGNIFD